MATTLKPASDHPVSPIAAWASDGDPSTAQPRRATASRKCTDLTKSVSLRLSARRLAADSNTNSQGDELSAPDSAHTDDLRRSGKRPSSSKVSGGAGPKDPSPGSPGLPVVSHGRGQEDKLLLGFANPARASRLRQRVGSSRLARRIRHRLRSPLGLTHYLTESCLGSTGQRNTIVEYLCWGTEGSQLLSRR